MNAPNRCTRLRVPNQIRFETQAEAPSKPGREWAVDLKFSFYSIPRSPEGLRRKTFLISDGSSTVAANGGQLPQNDWRSIQNRNLAREVAAEPAFYEGFAVSGSELFVICVKPIVVRLIQHRKPPFVCNLKEHPELGCSSSGDKTKTIQKPTYIVGNSSLGTNTFGTVQEI